MLKIYGQARSRTFRVIWLCMESKIPFEHDPGDDPRSGRDGEGRLVPQAQSERARSDHRRRRLRDVGVRRDQSLSRQEIQKPAVADDDAGRGPRVAMGLLHRQRCRAADDDRVSASRSCFRRRRRDAVRWRMRPTSSLQPKLEVLEEHLAANKYFGIDRWDMADFMVASVTFSLVGDEIRPVEISEIRGLARRQPRASRRQGSDEIPRLISRCALVSVSAAYAQSVTARENTSRQPSVMEEFFSIIFAEYAIIKFY